MLLPARSGKLLLKPFDAADRRRAGSGSDTAFADVKPSSGAPDESAPPDWIPKAVAYQIFVDRFCNGDPSLDPPNVVPWGSPPTAAGFMGGDLRGISKRLDYLADLGVNLVCLTPLFMSASNHRYDAYDYYRLDPRLGGMADFRELIREAHRRGIRILLDGVFNHCGRGFFPFFDVMENGAHSAWKDWFYVDGFPVDAYGEHRFASWQRAPSLPELNLANPRVRDYLLRVAEFWTAEGIDGWRMDAVRHARHREFWGELREAVRRVNPAAYVFAEIWEDPGPWLERGYFDGATNYRLRETLLEFVLHRSIGASEFARRLTTLLGRYPWPTTLGMWNLIGSHDTPRIRTLAGGDLERVKLALMLQFFLPGIPALYYGDEIGLEGGGDPDNRRAMVWEAARWSHGLRECVRKLAAMRRSLPALQRGAWAAIHANDRSGLCVLLRRHAGESAALVLHNGERRESLSLDLRALGLSAAESLVDGMEGTSVRAPGGILRLDRLQPATATLLVASASESSAAAYGAR